MSEPTRPIRCVLIAGPTASGKSALALALARAWGGVVVNADALQVYADLSVLTARPDADALAAAPHALYGHVDGAAPYAVGRWAAEASAVHSLSTADPQPGAAAVPAPGRPAGPRKLPIFVGGTGLYFEALTRGLATVPDIPEEVRARWRACGPDVDLHSELARRDPAMAARLRPSDPQRLMRALEVIDGTGRSLAAWQTDTTPGPVDPADALRIALAPDRSVLDGRIEQRLSAMIAAGAADEVDRLATRGLDPAAPVMKALGVAPLMAWRRGEIGRDAALERTRLETRRYAKRQSTWFRNRMADWLHVPPEGAWEAAEKAIARRGLFG